MKVRVLLVDDHPLYLLGIRAALDEAGCIEVVSECPTVQAVGVAQELGPDVMLMELPAPPGDGLRVIREVAELSPAPNVVVTSVLDDDVIIRALRAGVRGYLVRGAEPVEVRHAVSVAGPGRGGVQSRGRRTARPAAGRPRGPARPRTAARPEPARTRDPGTHVPRPGQPAHCPAPGGDREDGAQPRWGYVGSGRTGSGCTERAAGVRSGGG